MDNTSQRMDNACSNVFDVRHFAGDERDAMVMHSQRAHYMLKGPKGNEPQWLWMVWHIVREIHKFTSPKILNATNHLI